ncbi:MAG: hypothetical protein UH078_06380 [Macrococcus canis]|uniref:SH3 domain-containing protein n=1 Tax=Macrococcoides canis TaxID=1855823 RepID=A0A4R6C6R1_9STAP|nr:hypothetical protein [Macrococcus canis]MEE1107587.1 hypothetical protein [Macrococcus canis]TDM17513.1 hypothetical protein ETI04_06320 [Macrococcus canis]TDM36658.1 hypothetical protein ETI11_08745 [Macrococcus canis]TDM43734.1 hypothetical protein ETI09_04975 [Macrococcus canis]
MELLELYASRDLSFYILCQENDDNLITAVDDRNESVGVLSELNKKVVKVITTKIEDEDIYGLIEYNGELIGWIKIKESKLLTSIDPVSVKVDLTNFEVVPINKMINSKRDYQLFFNTGTFSARVALESEGRISLGLYKKSRFIGFVYEDDLHFGYNISESLTAKNLTTDLCYKDSDLKSQFSQFVDFDDEPITIILAYPTLDLVRFQHKNKYYYTKASDIAGFEINSLNLKRPNLDTNTSLINNLLGLFDEERETSRSIMQKLINENIALTEQMYKAEERKARVEQLYMNLSNSKLGRIQRQIWKRRR